METGDSLSSVEKLHEMCKEKPNVRYGAEMIPS
jgi:hypothetical protein